METTPITASHPMFIRFLTSLKLERVLVGVLAILAFTGAMAQSSPNDPDAKSTVSRFSYLELVVGASSHEDAYLESYDGFFARLKYGWQLHKYFALELNYNHFNLAGEVNNALLEDNSINAVGLGLKGVYPFSRDGIGSGIYIELSPIYFTYQEQHALHIVNDSEIANVDLQNLPDTLLDVQTTNSSGFEPFGNIALGYNYTNIYGLYVGLEVSFFSINPDTPIDVVTNRSRTASVGTRIDKHEVLSGSLAIGFRWF